MLNFAKVLLPLPFDRSFDYAIPLHLICEVGDYVRVEFGKKQMIGVVWEMEDSTEVKDRTKIKEIITKVNAPETEFEIPAVSDGLRKLIDWQGEYYVSEKGKIINLVYSDKYFEPVKERKLKPKPEKVFTKRELTLSPEQSAAVSNLLQRVDGGFSVTLIDGITGSGKTEVYFEAIDKIISSGKQALILLPEILLSSQMIKRFESRFGFTPVLWHSGITPSKRRKAFFDIARGNARVVIGARSALHLPFKDLGIIIVDEEHDQSFKQEEKVIYNARDVAVMRGKFENLPVLLSSATPSVETYHNVITGKYSCEKLKQRFNDIELPQTGLIDMRLEKISANEFISNQLREEIRTNLGNKQQSMLFLNRRGYAPLLLCGKCGFRFKSPDTSAWMVVHTDNSGRKFLQCHHSGFKMPMPEKCPSCSATDSFRACGPGIQRLTEEVKNIFPDARIMEIASDMVTSAKAMEEIMKKIESNEVDIIIGTQIVAKGHHFPALSLVGVIDADMGLDASNIKAGERTFQLLHQVAGRAGRENARGKVLIQTFNPEHKIMQCLKDNDKNGFLEYELQMRQEASLPPFTRICAITVSHHNNAESYRDARNIVQNFEQLREVKIMGPVEALYHEYRGQFRYSILLRAARGFNLQQYIRKNLATVKTAKHKISSKIKIDIDPYSF